MVGLQTDKAHICSKLLSTHTHTQTNNIHTYTHTIYRHKTRTRNFCTLQGTGTSSQRSQDCSVCHGSGDILRTKYSQSGFKALHVGVCPACGGKGTEARMICSR